MYITWYSGAIGARCDVAYPPLSMYKVSSECVIYNSSYKSVVDFSYKSNSKSFMFDSVGGSFMALDQVKLFLWNCLESRFLIYFQDFTSMWMLWTIGSDNKLPCYILETHTLFNNTTCILIFSVYLYLF